jgi:hypothetical protein
MSPTTLPFFADAEVARLCDGLEQAAAQIRYLKRLGLKVERKPNGRPLLMRTELERVLGASRMAPANDHASATAPLKGREPDLGALLQVIQGGRRGQKTQGR